MRWGVMPFRLDFEDDPEANVRRTFRFALRQSCHRILQLAFIAALRVESTLAWPHASFRVLCMVTWGCCCAAGGIGIGPPAHCSDLLHVPQYCRA